jgi:hypothetical protein
MYRGGPGCRRLSDPESRPTNQPKNCFYPFRFSFKSRFFSFESRFEATRPPQFVELAKGFEPPTL